MRYGEGDVSTMDRGYGTKCTRWWLGEGAKGMGRGAGAVGAVWWRGARDTATPTPASGSILLLGPSGSGALTTVVPLDYPLQSRAPLNFLPPPSYAPRTYDAPTSTRYAPAPRVRRHSGCQTRAPPCTLYSPWFIQLVYGRVDQVQARAGASNESLFRAWCGEGA